MIDSPVKWVGGKAWLRAELQAAFALAGADRLRRYVDPFCGGLAPFLAWHEMVMGAPQSEVDAGAPLAPPLSALLADANAELVRCYNAIQRDPAAVATALSILRAQTPAELEAFKQKHREVRNVFNAVRNDAAVAPDSPALAAITIWLTRCSFNGLWRVSRAGNFNSPPGLKAGPMPDLALLCALASALQHVEIAKASYATTMQRALTVNTPGVLYLDPPYVTAENQPTKGHTAYATEGFSAVDQALLAAYAHAAVARGWLVVVSNHDTPIVRGMFNGFVAAATPIRRKSISAGARKPAQEILLVGGAK